MSETLPLLTDPEQAVYQAIKRNTCGAACPSGAGKEIGNRITRYRLNQDKTQAALAQEV